jgi:uncharacterized protein (DUF885 family)
VRDSVAVMTSPAPPGTAGTPTPFDGDSVDGVSAALAALADEHFADQLAADPLEATYHGLPDHRDRLPDLTAAGQAQIRQRAVALRDRVLALDVTALGPTDQTSHAMLRQALDQRIQSIDAAWVEFGVDAFERGPQVLPLQIMSRTGITDEAGATDYHARLAGLTGYLQDALQRHRDGIDGDRPPVHRGVVAAISQCRSTAAQPADTALLLAPLRDHGDAAALQTGERLWDEVVVPALTAYADGLARDVDPHARPDDRVGLCWLDGGAALYDAALREFTTLSDPDPDVIHETGLQVIAELADEYAEIGGRFLGLTDLAAITERLHHDPELNYRDPAEIVSHAQALCDMAAARVGEVIGRIPATPCIVKAIPEVEARGAAAAFYQLPADGRPHGTYWVNTTDPVLPRAEAEATAFHEAAPGHHTQLALQVELDLPAFRRMGTFLSGYGEGWGLYSERLARELGMYSGDLGLLGMLATDSMRACRLVVDTGLHHRGWSRQQAIDFMRRHSPLPDDSVRAEVDRYIVYPGQACSYMMGRLEIQRLRADAESRLASAFDLRGFHDVVLGEGCVPLDVLGANVDRWVRQQVR